MSETWTVHHEDTLERFGKGACRETVLAAEAHRKGIANVGDGASASLQLPEYPACDF